MTRKTLCHFIYIIFLLCLVAVSWAQGNKAAPFNVPKAQNELQQMKDIFGTTIGFVRQSMLNTQTPASSALSAGMQGGFGISGLSRPSPISAYYLYGQGAVFIFALSNWNLPARTSGMSRGAGSRGSGSTGTQPASRESAEEIRAKNNSFLNKTRDLLIEAVANYGGALTTVKPDEYIALMLSSNYASDIGHGSGGVAAPQPDIISAKKSWITDYKSGELTLDSFKQKILQHKPSPSDTERSKEELRGMTVAFRTTTNAFAQYMQRTQLEKISVPPDRTLVLSSLQGILSINAYYLYGRGAVFVFSPSNWQILNIPKTSNTRNVSDIRGLTEKSASSGLDPQLPPMQSEQAIGEKDFQEMLKEQQDGAKQSQETQNATRDMTAAYFRETKGYLIDAVVNEGEYLTTVKPDEYITLVLMRDNSLPNMRGGDSGTSNCDIISIRKSWITDYKSGKLTIDAFKQKILQYEE